jgi:hypothetical protein
VPDEPVNQPFSPRHSPEFLHRQGLDITGPPSIQVASRGVMDGMIVPPVIVWSKGQDASYHTDKSISTSRFKERTVPAVVKDDECPHHESRRQDR